MRWIAVVDGEDGRQRTTISGNRLKLTQFEVGEPESTSEPVGMTVIIENIEDEPASALLAEDAADKLEGRADSCRRV